MQAHKSRLLIDVGYSVQFMMGRMYSALQDGMPELLQKDSDTHYFHCIDYIRQAVMCSGDVALEPHSENDGPDNGPQDGGWNGIHGELLQHINFKCLTD